MFKSESVNSAAFHNQTTMVPNRTDLEGYRMDLICSKNLLPHQLKTLGPQLSNVIGLREGSHKECKMCKERKPPLEEFFYMLIFVLKLVHPDHEMVLTCDNKEIWNEACKKPNLECYEYISFIQKYLDNYALNLKFKKKKRARDIQRSKPIEAPEVIKKTPIDQYVIEDKYFLKQKTLKNSNRGW